MSTIKRMFGIANESREDQQLNKRVLLSFTNKRDVWNGKRRFSY